MSTESQEIMKELCAGLVKQAHAVAEYETVERVRKNPIPTEEELRVGAFHEMIEPQVRDAVFEMHRKGYSTESSGFYEDDPSLQFISGFFRLGKPVIEALQGIGVSVEEANPFKKNQIHTRLVFRAKEPDLEKIRQQWAQIVAGIPDLGHPAEPAAMPMAKEFREKFFSGGSDIEAEALERIPRLVDLSDFSRNSLEKRIKKIRGEK